MSAMTNDPFTLARFAGFYKAIQSAVSILRMSEQLYRLSCSFIGCSRKLRHGRCSTAFPERNRQ
jgi:hypothetical protein